MLNLIKHGVRAGKTSIDISTDWSYLLELPSYEWELEESAKRVALSHIRDVLEKADELEFKINRDQFDDEPVSESDRDRSDIEVASIEGHEAREREFPRELERGLQLSEQSKQTLRDRVYQNRARDHPGPER
jgi:hypothetical protein